MSSRFAALIEGLKGIAFPAVCCLCEGRVTSGTQYVCIACRAETEVLDLHTLPENEMTDRFFGRLDITRAGALLPYGRDTLAERVMRLLKYDDRPDIGLNLGAWLGTRLAASAVFGGVDVVIPVPLHIRKRRKRGYNQAERVGEGVARGMGEPTVCIGDAVIRTRYTETQTRKTQFERISNVEHVFELSPKHASSIANKRILLVDDVMTTGATLEALGHAVERGSPAELKVATLALARLL